jgi:protoheme IX farnesyltransferase
MVRAYLELAKVRILAMASLSAAAGYLLFADGPDGLLAVLALGTGLMAAGASALNQVQERMYDVRMERTRNRPLPTGRLSPRQATCAAFSWLFLGGALLALFAGPVVMVMGGLAAVLYNGVYTPLKRRSAFAVLPGAVIGTLPPAMGWVAAGGGLLQPQIVGLMVFLLVWQIPHFWLLVLRYAKDYEMAGYPTVVGLFGRAGTTRVTVVWILATGVAGVMVPLLGAFSGSWGQVALAACALALGAMAMSLLGRRGGQRLRTAFVALNSFALMVLVVLVAERITGHF